MLEIISCGRGTAQLERADKVRAIGSIGTGKASTTQIKFMIQVEAESGAHEKSSAGGHVCTWCATPFGFEEATLAF